MRFADLCALFHIRKSDGALALTRAPSAPYSSLEHGGRRRSRALWRHKGRLMLSETEIVRWKKIAPSLLTLDYPDKAVAYGQGDRLESLFGCSGVSSNYLTSQKVEFN